MLRVHLYYDSTEIQPAHGNVDSSTTFVLRFDENPAGSRKRRFQYTTFVLRNDEISAVAGKHVDSSTTFVLRNDENSAGSRKRRFQYYPEHRLLITINILPLFFIDFEQKLQNQYFHTNLFFAFFLKF